MKLRPLFIPFLFPLVAVSGGAWLLVGLIEAANSLPLDYGNAAHEKDDLGESLDPAAPAMLVPDVTLIADLPAGENADSASPQTGTHALPGASELSVIPSEDEWHALAEMLFMDEKVLRRTPVELIPRLWSAARSKAAEAWPRYLIDLFEVAAAFRERRLEGSRYLAHELFSDTDRNLSSLDRYLALSLPTDGNVIHVVSGISHQFHLLLNRNDGSVRTLDVQHAGEARSPLSIEGGDGLPWPQVVSDEQSQQPSLSMVSAPDSARGFWLTDDRALYAPDGAKHPLAIRDQSFLHSVGFDESKGHTLELRALRYASGGRFVAVRGAIRVPTPGAVFGDERNPPRLDDLDYWEHPRTGLRFGDIELLTRAGFEGVLDRASSTLTPIRVWSFAEFAPHIISMNPELDMPVASPPQPETAPNGPYVPRGPVKRLPPRGQVHLFVHETPLPEERVVLSVSGDGEYVATADVDTRCFELMQKFPHGYEVALSLDYPLADPQAIRMGRLEMLRVSSGYVSSHPGAALLNPCAAFAGHDGRTLLVHQGHELSVWQLGGTPRLLAKRSVLPLGWFMVAPDGSCAVGVALNDEPWDGIPEAGWGVDVLVDGLNGERPSINALGSLLRCSTSASRISPLQAAMDADATHVRILFTNGGDKLGLLELPRPGP